MISIHLEGGKYTIESGAGFSRVLRYGEPWLDLNSMPGSKFFVSLVDDLARYQELEKAVEESKYEAGYGHNSSLMDMVKELVNYRNKYNQLKIELQNSLPIEISPPQYHDEAMGCGLEDRNIRDRYAAMEHGWYEAIFRFQDLIPEKLYEKPQLAIPDDWTPTPENINKLPDPLRSYIHELSTHFSSSTSQGYIAKDKATSKFLKLQTFQTHTGQHHHWDLTEDLGQATFFLSPHLPRNHPAELTDGGFEFLLVKVSRTVEINDAKA